MDIYIQWKKDGAEISGATGKTYTITFISGDTTIATNNVEAGSTIEYPTIEQSYVKDGKTFRFIGWSTNPQTALQSEIIYAVYAEEGKTLVRCGRNNQESTGSI